MTAALAETSEGSIANQSLTALLKDKTVVAIGPGLGTAVETSAFVRRIGSECRAQMVIDADGLNALVGFEGDLGGAVLTPHPGEMARLIGKSIESVTSNRIEVATDFAKKRNGYVVLKGYRTTIAAPNGSVYINPTGNPGMATGGTGDILTGMIAGMLAQEHLGSFIERLCLAVYLHGLAGDFAAEEVGEPHAQRVVGVGRRRQVDARSGGPEDGIDTRANPARVRRGQKRLQLHNIGQPPIGVAAQAGNRPAVEAGVVHRQDEIEHSVGLGVRVIDAMHARAGKALLETLT